MGLIRIGVLVLMAIIIISGWSHLLVKILLLKSRLKVWNMQHKVILTRPKSYLKRL